MNKIDKAVSQSMTDQIKSKLVWENASTASSMAAQTISLNLSAWDEVEIVIGNNSDSNIAAFVRLAKGDSSNIYANGVNNYSRHYQVTQDGIKIGNGIINLESDNQAAKPFVIYARKIVGGAVNL